MAARAAPARRVLVDDYTRIVISDRFIVSPAARLDPAHRAEVEATRGMFAGLAAAGVEVRITNPVGPWLGRYPARNHKKLILADTVAYLGGINFSDHNFAWRDFMLRIEGAAEAAFLADDFAATFAGTPRAARGAFPALVLASLDGRSNAAGFAELIALLDAARREITVISPYLTFPFTDALARARRRGVTVRLVTPRDNNKPLVRAALVAGAEAAGFEIRHGPGMSHVKALLIDGERLVIGSANFDFVSYAAEEEFLAIVTAADVVADFQAKIVEPALVIAPEGPGGPGRRLAGLAAEALLRLASLAARSARHAKRGAIDWPIR